MDDAGVDVTAGADSGAVPRVLASLAALAPLDVDASPELRGALATLDVPSAGETVVRAGYGAAAVAGALVVLAGSFVRLPPPVVVPVALAAAVGVAHGVHELPGVLAALHRRRALGRAPDLVARLALRLHVEPALEPAVAFAVDASDDALAAALAARCRRTDRLDDALLAFADAHAEDAPGLRRACHLLASAPDAPEGDRGRRVDRAFQAVLDGTRDRLRSYTTALSGPVNALYAFGVLLPLALVAVLPAAGAAGLPASLPVVVAVYDVCLPLVLLGATAWVLANRPVAFPPPRVARDHPAVPARRWPALATGALAGATVGGGAFALATTGGFGVPVLAGVAALVPPWLAGILGVGVGVGVAAGRLTAAAASVRASALAVEDGLVDAAYAVGRRVANGDAVEDALAAGAEVGGETGAVFETAIGVRERLGVGPREAFLGEHGALATVPSQRARAVVDLLSLAAAQGAPAGEAVVAVADHLEDLAAVERACRDDLAAVTSTLRSTGRVFGPLVGGATVALADGLASPDALLGDAPSTGVDPGALGVAVGAYVLALAGILAALAVVLEAGPDRVAVGRELATALPTAATAFTVGVVATGALV
ncbi:type II secretion system protein [Halorubellus sp. PRR65]|uniref:type II secretion system protein n=1 Tax=Halorubellus sp. PRR65 TaxID=3098148 RepID=UPI002B257518|nr:type II secretion system protein [Halorubellus sp. PRR65]